MERGRSWSERPASDGAWHVRRRRRRDRRRPRSAEPRRLQSLDYNRSFLGEFLLRRGLLGGQAGATTVEGLVAWAQLRLAAEHPDRLLWTAGDGTSIDLRPTAPG